VIQEILGARSLDILCGVKRISMEAFGEIISHYWNKVDLSTDSSRPDLQEALRLSPAASILRKHNARKSLGNHALLSLLEFCSRSDSRCQHIHDKIYGLLGIVKSGQREHIVPDYSKTLAELYLDVFLLILDGDKVTGNGFPTIVHPIGKDLIT
jgi:hypothetical protein